jgi:hypothetical protein
MTDTLGLETTSNVWGLVSRVYQDHGLITALSAIAAILIMLTAYEILKILFLKYIDNFIPFGKKKKKIKLEQSSAFKRLDSIIDHQIPNMPMPCPLRKLIFSKILITRSLKLKQLLLDETKRSWEISREDVRIIWDAFFAKLSYEWSIEARSKNVPDVAISKFVDFHKDNEKVMRDLVENLCIRSSGSIVESVSLIFEVIGCMEVSALFSAGDALNNLNGQISSLEFEGVSCLKCQTNGVLCPMAKKDN